MSEPTIRAVSRALAILRTMNRARRWTLHELHQETGLPKPTLFRMLQTLQADGFVVSDIARHNYSLTRRVLELSQGYAEPSALVAAAAPITREVTRRIHWPLALGLLEGGYLVVAHSTMPYSPLAVRTSTLGHKLAWRSSAMATIYLAFQPADRQQALLETLTEYWTLPQERQAFEHDLQALKTAGYAVRQASQRGESATLAVPILENQYSVAAIGMTTFAGSLTPRLIEDMLPVLQETAERVLDNVSTTLSPEN